MINFSLNVDDGSARSPVREFLGENSLPGPENATSRRISPFEALDELEFQKAFLLLSYVGRLVSLLLPLDLLLQPPSVKCIFGY